MTRTDVELGLFMAAREMLLLAGRDRLEARLLFHKTVLQVTLMPEMEGSRKALVKAIQDVLDSDATDEIKRQKAYVGGRGAGGAITPARDGAESNDPSADAALNHEPQENAA